MNYFNLNINLNMNDIICFLKNVCCYPCRYVDLPKRFIEHHDFDEINEHTIFINKQVIKIDDDNLFIDDSIIFDDRLSMYETENENFSSFDEISFTSEISFMQVNDNDNDNDNNNNDNDNNNNDNDNDNDIISSDSINYHDY